jgi:hypothetical protein
VEKPDLFLYSHHSQWAELPMTNTHKICMLACWLAIPSILVACSASPPKYHLDNDACSVVNASAFATLTDSNQPLTSEPSKLKDGLQGGNCEMRFVGPTGEVTLTTFIAPRCCSARSESPRQ